MELNYLFPGFGFNPLHIDDAHPLPTKRNNSVKLIVIRFKNRWVKRWILDRFEGKRLRRPNISVSQHLTEYTLQLRSLAAQIVGVSNISVEDTIIHANHRGKSYTIKYASDIRLLKAAVSASDSPKPTDQTPPLHGANLTPLGPSKLPVQAPGEPSAHSSATPCVRQPTCAPNDLSNDFPGLYKILTARGGNPYPKPPVPRGAPSRYGRGGFRGTARIPLNHANQT